MISMIHISSKGPLHLIMFQIEAQSQGMARLFLNVMQVSGGAK